MYRQVIKRLTMLGLVSMFTLSAAVASANAQLINPVRVKIPFDFNVGDKKLPAGDYTFSRLSGFYTNSVMSVSNADARIHVFQSTFEARVLTPKDSSTLVFHKYGDVYFLEQVWTGGEQEGLQLPESRHERNQQAGGQQSRLSGTEMKAETVEIVASAL